MPKAPKRQYIKAMIEVGLDEMPSREEAIKVLSGLPGYSLRGYVHGQAVEVHVDNIWIETHE